MNMVNTTAVLDVLGQPSPKSELQANRRALELVRTGLPAGVLSHLADEFGASLASIQKLVGLSKATGTRTRGKAAPLRPTASDRAYRLASVLAYAQHVFGDEAKARGWFQEPVRALGGARPFDLLDTEVGTQQVVRILGRIEYGVYS